MIVPTKTPDLLTGVNSKNERLTSDWVDLLGGLPNFEDWLRLGSTNFLYFVREPGHVELCRDPRFDF
jgi:hypothetical protein